MDKFPGIYAYNHETFPALVICDNINRIFETHYRYDELDLFRICRSHLIDYDKTLEHIRAVQPGTHTVMIDLPRYRDACAISEG